MVEIPFDFLVGHGCHFLWALPRNNEASLPLVESRIRERVVDTGSLNTEKPVLQNVECGVSIVKCPRTPKTLDSRRKWAIIRT